MFIAIFWAVSIHTVTAFLYVGLGGRPFWNSAIVGPRFLASAFTAGPALIILALQVIRRVTDYRISDQALLTLRSIFLRMSVPILQGTLSAPGTVPLVLPEKPVPTPG